MAGRLIMQEPPQLNAPYIMIGMNGWLNASQISTGSVDYLRRKLGARKFAYIETQGFYIYQIPSLSPELTMRPHAQIEDGLVMKLDIPQNDFFFWKSGTDHDLILFLGVEPNLGWPEYCQIILDVARQFHAPRIYSLGAFFDQVPHTRETRTLASVSHPSLKDELKAFAQFTNYEGPCSFTTMLVTMGYKQGIEVAGISARTPLYIRNFNSKVCYDLLTNILTMGGFRIDLSDLKQSGENILERMDRAFSENPTALAQLKKLEELFDVTVGETPLRGSDEDYDKLIEEVRKLKREGHKLH
ncbi:PAC2 family protein [Thermodesulfobacteriota bacterium]